MLIIFWYLSCILHTTQSLYPMKFYYFRLSQYLSHFLIVVKNIKNTGKIREDLFKGPLYPINIS